MSARADLIAMGMPWWQVDEFARAARMASMAEVFDTSLEGLPALLKRRDDLREHIRLPNPQALRPFQQMIADMLPGDRIAFPLREIAKVYIKITSTTEALFGPQISPVDYLRELNPKTRVEVDEFNGFVELTAADPLGLVSGGVVPKVHEVYPKDFSEITDKTTRSGVHQEFIRADPLSLQERDLLLRLKRALPEPVVEVHVSRMPRAAIETLSMRGIVEETESRRHWSTDYVGVSLTPLGKQFLGLGEE